jgi:hypothetical protein
MHSTGINAQASRRLFPQTHSEQPTLSTPTTLTTSTTTMFSKVFITALALVGAVSAAPTWGSGGSPTPSQQCCQNVQNSSTLSSEEQGVIAGLLGIAVGALNVPIGTGCTPIDVLGGVQCNDNTVNCGSTYNSELPLFHTHAACRETDALLY